MRRIGPRLAALAVIFWTALGIAVFSGSADSADDCGGIADQIQHGGVLWTENAIVVQGTAAPNLSNPNLPLSVIKRTTQSAASLDAYRKAAGVLTGVRVSSQAIAADNPRVLTRIQAFVQNAKICRAKYYADGGVDMVVMVPLNGAFAMEALSAAGTRLASGASSYTGLVVDAMQLPFAPAIAPRLLDPNGNVLFDVSMVRPETVRGQGAVQFVAAGKPLPADLVGARPLHVQAAALGAASPSDLILDDQAARALSGAPAFLADGRVAVVIHPEASLDCRGLFDAVADREVDWTRKLVMARGRGRVDFSRDEDVSVRMRKMERAAEVDAQRKLLETYLAVKVDGQRNVKAMPEVSAKAQGVIMNAMRCDARYYKDGSAEVVMAAPLDGLAAVSLDLGRTDPPPAAVTTGGPSGVIVDAGGLGFQPVLSPQIKSTDGRVLYGPEQVSKAYVQQYGVVGYEDSVAAARQDPRTGSSPLVIKASRLGGPGVLLLEGDSVQAMAQLAAGSTVLTQGRVIVACENARSPGAPASGRGPAAAPAPASQVAPRPMPSTGQGSGVRVGKINIP